MFKSAKRIWLKGLTGEMNTQARFVTELCVPSNVVLRLTGSTFYKVYIDGELIHHGPAPTATGFARVDVIELPEKRGKVSLSIEVAGYASNSYAAVNQESYVIAEVVSGDEVISFTGKDFRAYRVCSRSEILDSMPKNGTTSQNDDEYLCDKEVAYMLKVSRRTLSEYRSNGTLPYYVLGGKVLYKRNEIEQALKREYNGKHLMNGSG